MALLTRAPKQVQSTVVRKSNIGLTVVGFVVAGAVAFMSFIIPPVAAAINHVTDRVTNGIKAKRELKARMEWYRPQIAQTLGIPEERVTLADYKAAAAINPMLAETVKNVHREEAKENKTSAMINGAAAIVPGVAGVAAVGSLAKSGVGAGAKALGKQFAVATGSGMLVGWVSKSHIDAQEVAEGIETQLNMAREQGVDPRSVVTPQQVFLLRVAQDEVLADEIKKRFGKPFQKMSPEEHDAVMMEYPKLANAVTSEAYALGNGMLPVQELMARAPNLNGAAAGYRIGASNSSFVDALNRQRAAQNQAANRANF